MQPDTLELVPIDAASTPPKTLTPVAAATRAVATIKEAALARLTPTEIHLIDMADRFKPMKWDASTPKGLAEVKAARQEMREQGRYVVQNVVKATKTELNDLKATIEAEGERLIAIIASEEERADKVIKDAEERAAKVKALKEAIQTIEGYPELAKSADSVALAKGIAYVQGLDMTAERWGDLLDKATEAHAQTLATLRTMQEAALARELAEQQRREEEERQRAEVERMAALGEELKRIQRLPEQARIGNTIGAVEAALAEARAWDINPERWGVLAAAAEVTKAKAVEDLELMAHVWKSVAPALQATVQVEPAPEAAAEAAAAFPDLDDEDEAPTAEPAAPAPQPEPITVGVDLAGGTDATVVVMQGAAIVEDKPVHKLGDINAAMGAGFTMTSAYVSEVLKVGFTKGDRGAVLFTKAQRRALIAALIERACAVADSFDLEA